MKAALCQISPKLSKDNLALHIEQIEIAKKSADVIIFPELSMSGYMLMDSVFEDAYELSELDLFKELSTDIDIIFGAALRVGHKIYNSSLYYSKGDLLSIHHKNILPNYGMFQEARFFFKGKDLEFFESDFGKTAMVICEDMWNSKVIDKIVSNKPDFIYVLAASPARGFEDDGLMIEKKWNDILSSVSILCGANVLFVNRVGFEDGLGFWGGSRVISPNAKLEYKAKLFEKDLIIAELNHRLSKTEKYLLRI